MAKNGVELVLKGMSQQTKQRTELAYFSILSVAIAKGKEKADIKVTKRMACSTETQGPHIHAWRVQGYENCMLRSLCEWYASFFFFFNRLKKVYV